MSISKIKEVVSWMKGHNHLPVEKRIEYLQSYIEDVIDEVVDKLPNTQYRIGNYTGNSKPPYWYNIGDDTSVNELKKELKEQL